MSHDKRHPWFIKLWTTFLPNINNNNECDDMNVISVQWKDTFGAKGWRFVEHFTPMSLLMAALWSKNTSASQTRCCCLLRDENTGWWHCLQCVWHTWSLRTPVTTVQVPAPEEAPVKQKLRPCAKVPVVTNVFLCIVVCGWWCICI